MTKLSEVNQMTGDSSMPNLAPEGGGVVKQVVHDKKVKDNNPARKLARTALAKMNQDYNTTGDKLKKQHFGMAESSNSHYDRAEQHLSDANDAEAKGHMKAFHAHMADHHDAMSEWHDSKGRSATAEKHAEKAEYHHEKSLGIKEETLDELKHSTVSNYVRKAKTQLGNIEVSRRSTGDKEYGKEKARRRAASLDKIADKTHARGFADQLRKVTAPFKEETIAENHVEFRVDHRDKITGDVKKTMADHEAKVSDTTDKATYFKVPKHKADSFKSAMKGHGARAELEEELQLDEMQQGKSYTHKQLLDKVKTGNWEAQTDIKPGKHVEMRHHTGKRVTVHVKEEYSQIHELSSGALQSYKDKAMKSADDLSAKGNYKKSTDRLMNHMKATGKQIEKTTAGIKKAISGSVTAIGPKKEETEMVNGLHEANHREFASHGKMHPDMAKHMTVGHEMDYYEHGTGDKVSGKVLKNDGKEVHMKQTHDSYDPKKKGTVHKFKISSQLDEVLSPSATAGDYIDDFVHSKNPKFAGKSKDKRRQMALAAFYAANKKRGVKEEVESIEEAGHAGDPLGHLTAAERAKELKRRKEKIASNTTPANKRFVDKALAKEETAKPRVVTNKYSWGTMKVVHHGSDFSIPLHPEHHHAIAKLKDGQEHHFKDETGHHWGAYRRGDDVHFQSADHHGAMKTKVPHHTMKEETQMDHEYITLEEFLETATAEDLQEAWVLRQKKKEAAEPHKEPMHKAKKIKEHKSYRDFVTQLNEYETKNGSYVHKGSYGSSYQGHDDEDDEDDYGNKKKETKPADAPKRGRGRPAGSKSGAAGKTSQGSGKKRSGVEYTGYQLHLPNSNR